MTKTVSSYTTTEIAKRGASPHFLAYLGFSTPLYYSSRESITWAGDTFIPVYLDLINFSPDDFGADGGIIRLDNSDGALGAVILSQGIADKSIKVWELWGDGSPPGTWGVNDVELIFDGVIDSSGPIGQVIDLRLARTTSLVSAMPRVFYEHENILPAGTKIQLNGTTVTIDRAFR